MTGSSGLRPGNRREHLRETDRKGETQPGADRHRTQPFGQDEPQDIVPAAAERDPVAPARDATSAAEIRAQRA